jgi:hypothetical protein
MTSVGTEKLATHVVDAELPITRLGDPDLSRRRYPNAPDVGESPFRIIDAPDAYLFL